MKKTHFLLISLLATVLVTAGLSSCSGNGSEVDGTGTIEAKEVDVAPLQSGQITNLEVDEGDTVTKGSILAEIDHRILDLKLRQATSNEKQAQAKLDLLLAGARSEDIRQAQAGLEQAVQNRDLARKEWQRIQALYSQGSVTKKEYDTAESRFKSSQAGVEAAQASLDKVRTISRPQEITAAREAVKQAQDAVKIARTQIEDCSVTAPLDGTVAELYHEQGEVLSAGRPLLTLRDLREVHVTVYLPEPTLSHLKLGESAKVYVDGYPDRPFSGKISHINDKAEFTPKNVQTKEQRVKLVYAVKVRMQNEDGILKPGMPADVVFGSIPHE